MDRPNGRKRHFRSLLLSILNSFLHLWNKLWQGHLKSITKTLQHRSPLDIWALTRQNYWNGCSKPAFYQIGFWKIQPEPEKAVQHSTNETNKPVVSYIYSQCVAIYERSIFLTLVSQMNARFKRILWIFDSFFKVIKYCNLILFKVVIFWIIKPLFHDWQGDQWLFVFGIKKKAKINKSAFSLQKCNL